MRNLNARHVAVASILLALSACGSASTSINSRAASPLPSESRTLTPSPETATVATASSVPTTSAQDNKLQSPPRDPSLAGGSRQPTEKSGSDAAQEGFRRIGNLYLLEGDNSAATLAAASGAQRPGRSADDALAKAKSLGLPFFDSAMPEVWFGLYTDRLPGAKAGAPRHADEPAYLLRWPRLECVAAGPGSAPGAPTRAPEVGFCDTNVIINADTLKEIVLTQNGRP